ncbi:MAG: relaxase/mobilization nuclease, partial [Lachnospiraceae bacterium]|nr:relaxase/mobilization nuclease [Lachnospiraceae bacterium]
MAYKADKIASELTACGAYKYPKTSVKADAFKFDVSDAGGNLKLFMSVLDKLGVKLDGDQLYEEYQKIYDETVSRNEMYEKEQEKQWSRGR